MSRKYLETIKSVDGVLMNLSYHQQRLEGVTSSFKNSRGYNLKNILNPPKNGLYRCRVVYDEQKVEVEYIIYVKRQTKSLKLVFSDDIEYSKKYANRDHLNELFLLRADCDDILIVKNGLITDTSIANIAFFNGSKWITPKRALLKGTMREKCIQEKKIFEENIFIEDLKQFSKVALMNAMIDFDIIAQENIEEIIC